MTALFDEISSALESASMTGELAQPNGISTEAVALDAARLAVPLVVKSMADWAIDAGSNLVEFLRARTEADGGEYDHDAADEQLRRVFGNRLLPAIKAIEVEGRIGASSARGVLETVTDIALDRLSERVNLTGDRKELEGFLLDEQTDLHTSGWGPWIKAVDDGQTLSAPATVPTPLNGLTVSAPDPDPGAATAADSPSDRGLSTASTSTSEGDAGRVADEDRSKVPLLIGAVAALAIVGGGLFAVLSGGGDDSTDTVATESTDDTSDTEEESTDGDVAPSDGDRTTDETTGEVVDIAEDPIVHVEVPMTDIKGFSDTAVGTAVFDFDTTTGEICYSFEAVDIDAPFATHIHVGTEGIKGGVIVDFGPNESPASGCIDNPPADTNDILKHPASHYAELHDPSGDFTIRGQLSDADPMVDVPDLAFLDPEGGGALARVEAGRLVLEGEVADRATADRLAADYAALDLSGVQIVDDLTVTAGAPAPSGRVVLTDAIRFDVGSAAIRSADQEVLDVLVAIVASEPNSAMTIVGHTDSTGDPVANLELSLRRASALRNVLVDGGVSEDSLRVEGAGDTDPIAGNDTAEGRAQNRRIEVELKPVG